MSQRLERLRQTVDDLLRQQPDEEERRCGFVHLYGVAQTATLLALRRGLDVELAAVAGMLHDIATYETNDSTDHARRSAIEAERLLAAQGDFTPAEIAAVAHAIALHSDKSPGGGPLAELLKDADVLQHYLYNPALPSHAHHQARLERLCET